MFFNGSKDSRLSQFDDNDMIYIRTPVAFSLPVSTRHRFKATTPKNLGSEFIIC